jgi:2-oxoglutarate ferredoxin oxidoreductase subunit gamma
MHHAYWSPVRQRLRPGSVLFLNSSVFELGHNELDAEWRVVQLPATDLAVDVGSILTASLVMVGAYAAATGIVSLDALAGGLEASLPPYRRQHIAINIAALEAGHRAVEPGTYPAWDAAIEVAS